MLKVGRQSKKSIEVRRDSLQKMRGLRVEVQKLRVSYSLWVYVPRMISFSQLLSFDRLPQVSIRRRQHSMAKRGEAVYEHAGQH